ncbi:5' nucleotidase, NT5C type [Salinithrix halophila]|uniref:Nucleotidase n=1 Tax=Salinithrix halophila TaxID=1485204 RepID=A0ABV8JET9_9BACL
MIIGVDIDGTIKNTQEAAVRCFNDELGRTVQCEDLREFHLDTAFGLDRKEGRRLWRKLEPKIYSLGVPLENASTVLTDLRERGHDIIFITARPGMPHITEVTKTWLKKHNFPYDGENLHMNSQDKAKVAQRLGVGLFFEDAPQHLDRLIRAGVPTVIMDAVYNRDYPGDVPRITSWNEAYQWVEKYEKVEKPQLH